MIRSMTGYGRAVGADGAMSVTVELKSVNHRFFEFNAKVTRGYSFLEEKLKSLVQQYVSRGKIDCFVQIENEETQDGVVSINESLAAGYYNAIRSLCDTYGFHMSENVDILACHPDIFNVKKPPADEERIWNFVSGVALQAIEMFISMRETEGEKLKEDILSRCNIILSRVSFIEERSPQTVGEYVLKMKSRIRDLIGEVPIDEQRILTEAAVYADKIAVAEETVRLRSHIDQLHGIFNLNEPVGRKLDFLVQEINREANTIGSKAADVPIARCVIDIKAEVEKIREQIQNLE